jgi:hypothetical protein
MLENQEPFRTAFVAFNFLGLWRRELLKPTHRIAVTFFSIFCILFSYASLIWTLFHCETLENCIEMIFFICIDSVAVGYVLSFLVFREEIEIFFDEFNKITSKNVESFVFVNEKCLTMKKFAKVKMSIALIMGFFMLTGPILNGKFAVSMWIPENLRENRLLFTVLYIFHTPSSIYIASTALLFQDFFFVLEFMVVAYVEFFKSQLTKLNICGQDGRSRLVESIEIHLSVKR